MAHNREQWVVIGISGVTCGGKTTLANNLLEALSPVYVFYQDKYFYPDDSPHHVKCEGLDHNNYDILSALDMDTMYSDIINTMNGDNKAHAFNFKSKDTFVSPGHKFLVLEGFTVLNFKPIMELCDLRYFMVLEYSECVSRRVFRLYEPPDVHGYFEQCVWPEHIRHRAEIEKDKRVCLIDGMQPDALGNVMVDIRARCRQE